MNIEDKYKSLFENHKSKPDTKLWEQIEQKLDERSNSKSLWWLAAAACALIGLFIFQHEPAEPLRQEFAEQIQIPKIETTQLKTTAATKLKTSNISYPKITKANKNTEQTIALKSIKINAICTTKQNIKLNSAQIVHVKFILKNNSKNPKVHLKPDNSIKNFLDLTVKTLKKEKEKIQLPIIEIDYQSLIAKNQ